MPVGPRSALHGERFGRLVVLSAQGTQRHCICDCGNNCTVRAGALTAGYNKSCGCLYAESRKTVARRHGAASGGGHTRAYKAWAAIRQRCLNPKDKRYPHYGGRGITVCDQWLESFEAFYRDTGDPPPLYSLERRDNNAGYSPGNCLWATVAVQNRNTRRNRKITWRGRTQTLTDWAAEFGLPVNTLRYRLARADWDAEAVFPKVANVL